MCGLQTGEDMLSNLVHLLLKKYRIPPSELRKEVLVDKEILENEIPDGIDFPFAFPGLPFRFHGGVAWEEGKKAEAVKAEYGVEVRGKPMEFSGGTRLFLEAPPEKTRDVLEKAAQQGYEEIIGVCRERLGVILSAEPGWPEYSPLTVIYSLFYDVEAYRMPAQSFYPHPKGSMAWVEARLKERPRINMDQFLSFLKRLFTNKKKKVSNIVPVDEERRPYELPPERLLEIYELVGGE